MLYFLLVIFVGFVLLFLNYIFSSFNPDKNKNTPFECGFISIQQTREPFHISFFLVGILFLLFDVEISFVYPFIASVSDWYTSSIIMIFLLILSSGIVYEMEKQIIV